jgi:hypothetical protein
MINIKKILVNRYSIVKFMSVYLIYINEVKQVFDYFNIFDTNFKNKILLFCFGNY